METLYHYVGIDVSQAKLDLAYDLPTGKYTTFQVSNQADGFACLLQRLPAQACCVMEATGAYHCQLAFFLAEHSIPLVVANPLSVKYFAKLNLQKTKTDKADAVLLAQYGQCLQPPLWHPPADELVELKQLYSVLEQFTKQHTALTNQKKSLLLMPHYSQQAIAALDNQLAFLKQSLAEVETQLLDLLQQHYHDLNERLQSIPGIGPKTALMLIVISQGFQAFEHAKQLIAFVGLAPRIQQSGKSVKAPAHISKQGTASLRKLLYLAAWQAKRCNLACRQLYERLLERGKKPKLALIAVANKLIKQAFAIAKTNSIYQKDFKPNFIFKNA